MDFFFRFHFPNMFGLPGNVFGHLCFLPFLTCCGVVAVLRPHQFTVLSTIPPKETKARLRIKDPRCNQPNLSF